MTILVDISSVGICSSGSQQSQSDSSNNSIVRVKARRRWERRVAQQRQRWKQMTKDDATARRPHELAAEEEHERILVDKACKKLAAAEDKRPLKYHDEGNQDATHNREAIVGCTNMCNSDTCNDAVNASGLTSVGSPDCVADLDVPPPPPRAKAAAKPTHQSAHFGRPPLDTRRPSPARSKTCPHKAYRITKELQSPSDAAFSMSTSSSILNCDNGDSDYDHNHDLGDRNAVHLKALRSGEQKIHQDGDCISGAKPPAAANISLAAPRLDPPVIQEEDDALVHAGHPELHQITMIQSRGHCSMIDRSLISELSAEDISFNSEYLELEAAEVTAMAESILSPEKLHTVSEEPSIDKTDEEWNENMNLLDVVAEQPQICLIEEVSSKQCTKIDNGAYVSEQELSISKHTRMTTVSDGNSNVQQQQQITCEIEEKGESVDTVNEKKQQELLASIRYSQSQLNAVRRDIANHSQIEQSLITEINDLLEALGLERCTTSHNLESRAREVFRLEEEMRSALQMIEAEIQSYEQSLSSGAESEASLQLTLKDLSTELVDFEARATIEEIKLLEKFEARKEEEKALREEYNGVVAKLHRVADCPIDRQYNPNVSHIEDTRPDDQGKSGNNSNNAASTDGKESEPFDAATEDDSELSAIISDHVDGTQRTGTECSHLKNESVKRVIKEMESMGYFDLITQFEEAITELESNRRGKSSIAPPPGESSKKTTTRIPNRVADDIETPLPVIVASSSPLKIFQGKQIKPGGKSNVSQSNDTTSVLSLDVTKETEYIASPKDVKFHSSSIAMCTKSTAPFNASVDTPKEPTSENAVVDLGRQYLTPGTPRRLANFQWTQKSPRRVLNLSCSVIEMMDSDDTVSSIGSKEPLVRKLEPETPQRISSLAQKCHEQCSILDVIMPFASKSRVPEDKSLA